MNFGRESSNFDLMVIQEKKISKELFPLPWITPTFPWPQLPKSMGIGEKKEKV